MKCLHSVKVSPSAEVITWAVHDGTEIVPQFVVHLRVVEWVTMEYARFSLKGSNHYQRFYEIFTITHRHVNAGAREQCSLSKNSCMILPQTAFLTWIVSAQIRFLPPPQGGGTGKLLPTRTIPPVTWLTDSRVDFVVRAGVSNM